MAILQITFANNFIELGNQKNLRTSHKPQKLIQEETDNPHSSLSINENWFHSTGLPIKKAPVQDGFISESFKYLEKKYTHPIQTFSENVTGGTIAQLTLWCQHYPPVQTIWFYKNTEN